MQKPVGVPPSPPKGGTATDARRAGTLAAIALAVLASYVVLEWVSFIHEFKGVPITPWNPGLGVVFGFMMWAGPAAGVLLFAGTIAAETLVLHTALPWPIVLGIAALSTSSYVAIAEITRRALKFDVTFIHLHDVLVLLGTGLAGALTSAILLTGLLVLSGSLEARDFWSAAVPQMVGDMIGIAVVTPLLLRFVFRHPSLAGREFVRLLPDTALYSSLILAALTVITGTGREHASFYVLFVPIVAVALRRGLDGACLGLTATQLGLVGLLHLHGYDARIFTEFQVLMVVLTATGLIVGVVVSERRNADQLAREAEARLKEKEAEAAQVRRFNLVSGMATALAHEITQPMTAARALARSAQHILATPGGDLARAEANLATLVAHIDHAGQVLRHVREFLRRGTPELSIVDLHALLADAASLIRSDTLARSVEIEFDVPADIPALRGDEVQLLQVLLNLIRNAIEAIGPDRRGRIRVAVRAFDDPTQIEFSVVDDGPGVSSEISDQLFNPLSTSKHEGLGLGLSICASIIVAHHGRIWLQSSVPGRTEFRFSLPLDPSPPA